nr:MAG TPA: hypothetical protein [Caudoviricetes sp.]
MLRHQRKNHLRFDYKKFFRGFYHDTNSAI